MVFQEIINAQTMQKIDVNINWNRIIGSECSKFELCAKFQI